LGAKEKEKPVLTNKNRGFREGWARKASWGGMGGATGGMVRTGETLPTNGTKMTNEKRWTGKEDGAAWKQELS